MNPTMESIMKSYIAIPSRKPTSLVEHVFMMLFHDIAAIFLTFTIINWIFDRILAILRSRRFRRWSRRICRRLVYSLGILCGRVGLVFIKGLKMLGYVLAKVQDALRGLVLAVAEGNLVLVNICLAVGDMGVEEEYEGHGKQTKKKEVKREGSHSSSVVEAAVKSPAKPALKVTFKPAVKTRSRAAGVSLETSLGDYLDRYWSNEHGNLSPQCLRVETSLEDDHNRNWSNEHGNLSPGSSPTARSTSPTNTVRPAHTTACTRSTNPTHCTDPTRPLRCERPNPKSVKNLAGPGPSGLSSSMTDSAVSKPEGSGTTFSELKFDRTAYEEYLRTRTPLEFRRAVFGPYPLDAASASTSGESVVRTPSTSSKSDDGIDTPSASATSPGGIHTPSSTRSPGSGDSSSRGLLTPTSTSSPESEVMAIHTPPYTGSPDSGVPSRLGTPDLAPPSESDETVIRAPSP